MTSVAPDTTIKPGVCWWCSATANSREHRMKASDLRREYGKPPYTSLRALTRFSGTDRHDFKGPNSALVKFEASLCARCNDTRSQPFDTAWDMLATYIADHEAQVVATRQLNWADMLGPDWKARGADIERYVLKHALCRIVEQLPGPITLAGEYIDFLEGTPRPMMEIDLTIDLGVLEMLRATREAPPPEEPEAADAGFLGLTDLWVQKSEATGEWSQPQAGLMYRYLGVFWRLGAGSVSPFERQTVVIPTGEDMFGPGFRRALASARGHAT